MKACVRHFSFFIVIFILLFNLSATAQWVQTNGASGSNVLGFTTKNTDIYAGYNNGVNSGGVIRSTNYGTDWTNVNTGLPSVEIMALTTLGDDVFASEYDGGIYLSSDDGANWNITALTVEYILGFASIGNNLFAASANNGVYLSTDNGTSWNFVNSGLTTVATRSIFAAGTNLFVGTHGGGGIFLSTNNGGSWTAVNTGLTQKYIYTLEKVGSNVFAGSWSAGVFRTTNNGANWTSTSNGLPSDQISAFAVSGSNLFAATYGSGVYLSTNNGDSWTEVNNGLTALSLNALAVCGPYLYAGGSESGVWRRPLSEMITDVDGNHNDLPVTFDLLQNFPNPFNPSTRISFQLPKEEFVTLKIYDMLGSEISTLVNEEKPAGKYEVDFNASQLTSGVYIYKIQAGEFTGANKMILMK